MTTYTPEDFARCFSLRGYGKRKAALEWCEENGVTAPTEDDFERCWRDLDKPVIRRHGGPYVALNIDGSNPVAASNVCNSYGASYNAQMRRELKELDKLERALQRRVEGEQIQLPQDHH